MDSDQKGVTIWGGLYDSILEMSEDGHEYTLQDPIFSLLRKLEETKTPYEVLTILSQIPKPDQDRLMSPLLDVLFALKASRQQDLPVILKNSEQARLDRVKFILDRRLISEDMLLRAVCHVGGFEAATWLLDRIGD